MLDVYTKDRERISGITRGAEIAQRMEENATRAIAAQIETEQRAAAAHRAEALQREAQEREQAEVNAVEKLRALVPLYAQREDAARAAIEALAGLWRVEQELRAGLSNADRSLQSVEVLIDVTQRGAWRSALRDRAGLPARHIFNAPKPWIQNDGQKVGATACAAITASVIQPGAIVTAHDAIDFNFE